jgi:hypothetical protein
MHIPWHFERIPKSVQRFSDKMRDQIKSEASSRPYRIDASGSLSAAGKFLTPQGQVK